MPTNQGICLVMIVKDEAQYIERCLMSALPFCEYAVIVDTGSTDTTQDEAWKALQACGWRDRGAIVNRQWVNFSTNRNEAIQLVRDLSIPAKWLLFLDGDEEIIGDIPTLDPAVDGYNVQHGDSFRWFVPRLVNAKHAWKYVGACHEYITAPGIETWNLPTLPGVRLNHMEDGSRSNEKLMRNFYLLRDEYERGGDKNPRTVFYLAETAFALGNYMLAAELYNARAKMGGWDEERWYAAYKHVITAEKVMQDREEVESFNPLALSGHLGVHEARPTRIEPLLRAIWILRDEKLWHSVYALTSQAIKVKMPDDRLFVDALAYEWHAPLEHGMACLALGKWQEARDILTPLVGKPGPSALQIAAKNNLERATDKLS